MMMMMMMMTMMVTTMKELWIVHRHHAVDIVIAVLFQLLGHKVAILAAQRDLLARRDGTRRLLLRYSPADRLRRLQLASTRLGGGASEKAEVGASAEVVRKRVHHAMGRKAGSLGGVEASARGGRNGGVAATGDHGRPHRHRGPRVKIRRRHALLHASQIVGVEGVALLVRVCFVL